MHVKVLHLITTLDTGGAEIMLLKLLSSFGSNRMSHYVIGMTGVGTVGKQIQAMGVPVACLGFTRGSVSFSGLIKLIRLLRRIDPNIIQTWMYHANVLGLLMGKLVTKAKIVWNIRASVRRLLDYKPLTLVILYLGRLLSKMPDAVVFNSQTGIRDHLKWGFQPKKVRYIPNGFDLNLFQPDRLFRHTLRPELSIGEQEFCVGFFGRFEPVKDHRTFFKAADRVHQKRPDIQFILCGEIGEENRTIIKAWIREFHLDACVHVLGLRSNIHQIMPAMDTIVSSSKSEGFSNVIGEALACGVPCVVTDVGDSALIVGCAGKVVPAENPFKMAEAIVQLAVLPPKKRQDLGIAGRNRIKTYYSLAVVAKKYKALYRSMMGQPV